MLKKQNQNFLYGRVFYTATESQYNRMPISDGLRKKTSCLLNINYPILSRSDSFFDRVLTSFLYRHNVQSITTISIKQHIYLFTILYLVTRYRDRVYLYRLQRW